MDNRTSLFLIDSSPIQTLTVGFGFSPNPPAALFMICCAGHGLEQHWVVKIALLIPPVGNFTLPRTSIYLIVGSIITDKSLAAYKQIKRRIKEKAVHNQQTSNLAIWHLSMHN
jgi:hypothetical protein